MGKKEHIIKHSFILAFSSYFLQFVAAIIGFITKRLLGPTLTGTFSLLMIFHDYIRFADLGVRHAVKIKMPLLIGRGKKKEANIIKNLGFSFTLLSVSVVCLIVIFIDLFIKHIINNYLFYGIIIITFFSFCSNVITYYLSVFQATKRFSIVSTYNILYAALALLLKIALTYFYGLYGLLISMVLINIIIFLYFMRKEKLLYYFNWEKLYPLLKFGFPLIILQFVTRSIFSIDRIIIAKFFTFEQLGFYSIAIMAHSFLYSAPGKFVTVISPFFLEKVGKDRSHKKSLHYIIKPTLIIAYFFAFLIGLLVIVYPLLVNFIIPQFTAGIVAAKIIMYATFFLGIVGMSTSVITALEKQKVWLMISVVILILSIIFNFIVIKLGYGIEGVAFASLISFFLYTSSIMVYALHLYEKGVSYMVRLISSFYFPIIYTIAAAELIMLFIIGIGEPTFSGIVSTIAAMAVFIALYLPLFYYINRKTRVIKLILGLIKKKILKR